MIFCHCSYFLVVFFLLFWAITELFFLFFFQIGETFFNGYLKFFPHSRLEVGGKFFLFQKGFFSHGFGSFFFFFAPDWVQAFFLSFCQNLLGFFGHVGGFFLRFINLPRKFFTGNYFVFDQLCQRIQPNFFEFLTYLPAGLVLQKSHLVIDFFFYQKRFFFALRHWGTQMGSLGKPFGGVLLFFLLDIGPKKISLFRIIGFGGFKIFSFCAPIYFVFYRPVRVLEGKFFFHHFYKINCLKLFARILSMAQRFFPLVLKKKEFFSWFFPFFLLKSVNLCFSEQGFIHLGEETDFKAVSWPWGLGSFFLRRKFFCLDSFPVVRVLLGPL